MLIVLPVICGRCLVARPPWTCTHSSGPAPQPGNAENLTAIWVNRIKAAYVARRAITEAMQRLLAGKPRRSSGRLDIVTLAEEAGLKRNKLTHNYRPQGPLQRRASRPRRCAGQRTPAPGGDRRPDQEDQGAERGTRPIPDGERDLRASNKRPHHRERQPPLGHRETQIVQRHITAVPALKLSRSASRRFIAICPAGPSGGTVSATNSEHGRGCPESLRGNRSPSMRAGYLCR